MLGRRREARPHLEELGTPSRAAHNAVLTSQSHPGHAGGKVTAGTWKGGSSHVVSYKTSGQVGINGGSKGMAFPEAGTACAKGQQFGPVSEAPELAGWPPG